MTDVRSPQCPVEEDRVTVAEYAAEWLAQLQVKPSTKSMYASIVRHQLGHLGSMRLTRVASPDILAILTEATADMGAPSHVLGASEQ